MFTNVPDFIYKVTSLQRIGAGSRSRNVDLRWNETRSSEQNFKFDAFPNKLVFSLLQVSIRVVTTISRECCIF